jgi:hypothetical protein
MMPPCEASHPNTHQARRRAARCLPPLRRGALRRTPRRPHDPSQDTSASDTRGRACQPATHRATAKAQCQRRCAGKEHALRARAEALRAARNDAPNHILPPRPAVAGVCVVAVHQAAHHSCCAAATRLRGELAQPRDAMFCDSQSRPSYRPSPDVAHVLWMYL